MKYLLNFLLITAVIFGLNSCKKQISLSADITGKMLLLDRMDTNFLEVYTTNTSFDYSLMNDHSGITVRFYKDKKHHYETQTDKDGYFYFHNIPTGTYNVTFTKAGYSTFSFKDYMVVGGATELFTYPNRDYSVMREIHKNLQHKANIFIRNDSIVFDIPDKNYYYYLLSTEKNITDSTFMDYYNLYYDKKCSLDWERKFLIFNAGDTIYWKIYDFEPLYHYFNDFDCRETYNEVFMDWYYKGKYCRIYGLSNENTSEGYIVIPDNYVSKLPDGVINPVPKQMNNKPLDY